MRIFDDNGLMIFPSQILRELRESTKVVVVQACYCPRGHNLINDKAQFSEHGGILLRVRDAELREGLVALSPIYGDKSRISLGLRLEKGDVIKLLCPECGVPLPVYDECSCGADLIALFTRPVPDYGNCIGICNRVGCYNAELKNGNELLTLANLEEYTG
ncbi:MAG: hypothetical protein JXA28_10750 [Bacteroidetes bacterium]|nr:hypothetical protein [Bacteroidota bacterium]